MPKEKWNQQTVASHFRVNFSFLNNKIAIYKLKKFSFQNSLAELLDKMKDAEPFFVR